MSHNRLTYKSLDTQFLSEQNIRKIAEIEQDAWAHGIGEYIKCLDCETISSKSDIYGGMSRELYSQTVAVIRDQLSLKEIFCPHCSGDTEFIYGEDYIDEVRNRHKNYVSFLTVCVDSQSDIVGFIDGYVSDFSTIFDNEFRYYYGGIGEAELKEHIEGLTGIPIPPDILSWTSMGLQQSYKSLFCVFGLIQNFFESMPRHQDYYCISESAIGTNTHAIYHAMGAKQVGLVNIRDVSERVINKSRKVQSDIFIQEDIVSNYQKNFGESVKEFLKNNKKKMREVLVCS